MANLWYVGVLLEIVSTMSGTVGKQMIRMSELTKDSFPVFSRQIFRGGLVVNTVVGPLLDMAAYSFANQSLIAPFGGLDVVWNAALAPWILKETLSTGRLIGCVFILIGTTLAGIFGNHEENEYTVEYLENTLLQFRNLIYFVFFFAWFLVNYFYFMTFPKGSICRGLSLGCTAGTIAGNMFCVKGSVELIQRTFQHKEYEIWTHWLPYVLLIGAAFFALSNVVFMTKGLMEYEALFMVTIYEGSMIVSGCVSGAVVLLDLQGLEAWRIAVYGLGVFIVIGGMSTIFQEERRSRSSLAAGTASIATMRRSTKLSTGSGPGSSSPTARVPKMESFDHRSMHANVDTLDKQTMSSPTAASRASRRGGSGDGNIFPSPTTSTTQSLASPIALEAEKGGTSPRASGIGNFMLQSSTAGTDKLMAAQAV